MPHPIQQRATISLSASSAASITQPITAILHDRRTGQWLQFGNCRNVLAALTPEAVAPVIREAEQMAARDACHVVGFISYEAASALNPTLVTAAGGVLPLAWFAVFRDAQAAPAPTAGAIGDSPALTWEPSIDASGYSAAMQRIRALIAAGDTYQVNFSYRLRAHFERPSDARLAACMGALNARQPGNYGAFLTTPEWAIMCASHELFFEREGAVLRSRPMKGTAARGPDRQADREQAAWLAGSSKNRAENLMITDMVRNDLGRIALPGSVRTSSLFALERYPTLWQMTSSVTARTEADLVEILGSLFPAASITGAPKRRTMAIIHELEPDPRQIYTGTIGYLRPDGSAQFNVAIRTVLVDRLRELAEYGVGGGIVWDSDEAEEFAESRTKAVILDPPEASFDLLETLRWDPDHGYRYLAAHIDRLLEAATWFGFPVSRDRVMTALAEATRDWPPIPHRVRLLVDRAGIPTVAATPLTPLRDPWRLALAPAPSPVEQDPFVRHKTTRRAIYETVRKSVPGADDVLLWNTRGEITESTIANVLVLLDDHWVTPPVSSGLLSGIGRAQLLAAGVVREQVIRVEDLARAEAVELVNALRGRWSTSWHRPPPPADSSRSL